MVMVMSHVYELFTVLICVQRSAMSSLLDKMREKEARGGGSAESSAETECSAETEATDTLDNLQEGKD